MTLLFFSAACDWCDGQAAGQLHEGFVVYRGDEGNLGRQVYVFRTMQDAERWRAIRALEGHDVRRVISELPFNWRQSSGTIQGLELADQLFTIHPDHRYPPGPRHAHLA